MFMSFNNGNTSAIKSRMLLPKYEEEIHDIIYEEEEDPRGELVEQLIEYKKYKEAAHELKQKEHDLVAEMYMKSQAIFQHMPKTNR